MTIEQTKDEVASFEQYTERFKQGIPLERLAHEQFNSEQKIMNKTKVESGIKMANEIEKTRTSISRIAYGINMGIHCRSDLYDRRRYGASIFI